MSCVWDSTNQKKSIKKINVPYWSFDGQTWRDQVAVIAEIEIRI